LLVRLEACPGPADHHAKLPETARELALAETGTIAWYASRIGDNTFGGFATFADEEGRRADLAGEIAVALGKVASELPTTKPLIEEVTIVAVK